MSSGILTIRNSKIGRLYYYILYSNQILNYMPIIMLIRTCICSHGNHILNYMPITMLICICSHGNEIYPIEDELIDGEEAKEGANVKPLTSPAVPTRQNLLEHNIANYLVRSWCAHCARGKCKAS